MILELRKMEMEGQFIIHLIWIAGKRMIAQGSDGLSRGDFSSGVMNCSISWINFRWTKLRWSANLNCTTSCYPAFQETIGNSPLQKIGSTKCSNTRMQNGSGPPRQPWQKRQ
jgi:hypothetical protein